MSEELAKGPIIDSLKAKLAQLVDKIDISNMSLTELVAFAKMLFALFANKPAPVFGASSADTAEFAAALDELDALCKQAEESEAAE